MRPSALAFALALSGCAAAPQAQHEYEVRTTVYEMPAELARSLTGTESNGGMPAPADLSERASAAASTRTDVQVCSRPMIRVNEGSTAELSNISGTDYIQDYAVGADGKAQAVHATAEEGLALELKPARRESGLELAYRVELSQLVQWTEETERTLSNGERVKLRFPIVAKRGLQSKTSLAEGECLALLLSPTFSGRTTLVCVSAVPVAGGR